MIDIRKLKELVRLMVENDLSELDLHDQQETVTIKRGSNEAPVIVSPPLAQAPVAEVPAAQNTSPAAAPPAASESDAKAEADANLVPIVSPMVGTFYAAANPDAPPFVSIGDAVSADTVVCLVEAMKVFNEIKAEKAGTIERVLVNNGDAVEFGQTLFLLKPA